MRLLHRSLTTLAAAAVLSLGASAAFAQPHPACDHAGPGDGHRRNAPPSPEERIEFLTEHLALDDAQQKQIRDILDRAATERARIEDELGDDPPRAHRQMMRLRLDTEEAIEATLRPDQLEKLDNLRRKRFEEGRKRRGDGSGHGPRDGRGHRGDGPGPRGDGPGR